MELKRYRTLALEILKTLNILNPTYMHCLLYLRSSSAGKPNNITIARTNTITYGTKSLRSLGPQIQNSLPKDIKAETSCFSDQLRFSRILNNFKWCIILVYVLLNCILIPRINKVNKRKRKLDQCHQNVNLRNLRKLGQENP